MSALTPPSHALGALEARSVIAKHSKSFSLSSLLLGRAKRFDAEVLYAYCRRADDAIDLVAPAQQAAAWVGLHRELDLVYRCGSLIEPTAAAFQRLVFARDIPRAYPEALLEGLALDANGKRYTSLDELLHYCWCVAGSVGAMMCHVLGASRQRAVAHGVHLGMAMQLTNICRDIAEDWQRGRLYVPSELLPGVELRGAFPPLLARRPLRNAVGQLLSEADALYRSADAGLRYLPLRARFAVAAARRLYSGIGEQLRARGCDALQGRVVVSASEKVGCVARAFLDAMLTRGALARGSTSLDPVRYPEDVLPV
jgi:phytoene synthase